jgi:HAD superfamily hydrolase (TIGR01549 family)
MMLIIFDFDGPIHKASWRGLFEAYKAIVRSQKKNYKDFFKNLAEFKKWWSPDWRKNTRKLGIRSQDLDKAHWYFYEIYNSYAYLFPWLSGILKELRHRHQLALVTNRHRESAEKILGSLKGHFSFLVGAEDVKKLKPSPEGIMIILRKSCINPEDALIIGDMPDDILAGKAAGIKTGAVKWGLGDWDELMAYLPDYSFEKPEHLLQI